MLHVPLDSIEDTASLGTALARAFTDVSSHGGALLLTGDLGAGKTTLTRYLVAALPQSQPPEVSSPSFTICNIYCTFPCIHHYDLYRLETQFPNDALAASFDEPGVLTIVEWAEHMHLDDAPADGIACALEYAPEHECRRAVFTPLGPDGVALIRKLQTHFSAITGRTI